MWQQLLDKLHLADRRALARAISLVENEYDGWLPFLQQLPAGHARIIGITGPPGAGKSTLTDALIGHYAEKGEQVAVLCVDPSSPFHFGAVLGDRIRMSRWYNHPGVFIRSLASRGSLGGLNQMILEITAVLQAARFDKILIETIGIGQSEVEIAGLADTTLLVLVPEAGDEIQTMKAGVMEIADLFVVNKSDRPDADRFVQHLRQMMAPAFSRQHREIPILRTVASQQEGINELIDELEKQKREESENRDRKVWLLTTRLWQIIQRIRMEGLEKNTVRQQVELALQKGPVNLFQLAAGFTHPDYSSTTDKPENQ